MMAAGSRTAAVASATTAVRDAGGVESALRAAVRSLAGEFDILRASIRELLRDGRRMTITALVSARPTALVVGATMSVNAASFPEIVASGRPIVWTPQTGAPQLADDVLLAEGIRSWITIPLHAPDGSVDGLLSFSSERTDGFSDDDDAEGFAELGRAVDEVRRASQ